MSTQVQYRRGSNVQVAAFTGALGELVIDTTNKIVVVNDGATVGGFPGVGLTATQTITNKIYQGTSVSVSGNVAGGNINTGGVISATGNIIGGNILGTIVGTISTTSASVSGNITGGNIITAGNVTGGNVLLSGLISASGAITSGTTIVGGNLATAGTVSATANITGGNVLTGGVVSATANIRGGNITTAGAVTNGNITITGATIVSTGATLTLDPNGSGGTDGNVVIAGNLTVQGTTTTISSNTVTTNDLVINVANNAATSSAANGGGLGVGPAGAEYASLTFNNSTTSWNTSIPLSVTGTITGGNLATGGTASATGTITGGNLATGGTVSATGTATAGNLTSAGVLTINSSNQVTAIVNGGTNGVGNIGASGATFNTVFAKATTAQYADLAEIYVADNSYGPGTVVEFGGNNEITITTVSHSVQAAGIISTTPAYLMNSTQQGEHALEVALVGRVPCQVVGSIRKGDRLVSSGQFPGVATVLDMSQYQPGCIIGKALEDYQSTEVGTIEVAVGRL